MHTNQAQSAERPNRVLILEDDMLNAFLIEETLQFAGHQVVGPAKTIPHALKLLRDGGIDAAILDLQIDDTVSFEVGRQLDELGIPWAITTAHAPSVIVPEFSHVQALIKPFTVGALLTLIEGLLDDRQLN